MSARISAGNISILTVFVGCNRIGTDCGMCEGELIGVRVELLTGEDGRIDGWELSGV